MNRFLVMTALACCFLAESCSRSQLPSLQPMRHPIVAPRAASPSRVAPIGRDPLACIVATDINAVALSATACTFNLPAFPVSFTITCSINFILTTGTSGNVGLDIIPSTAPANSTTFASQSIVPLGSYSSVVRISASGDQTVLGGISAGNIGVNVPENITMVGTWPSSGAASQTFSVVLEETTNMGMTLMAGSFCRMAP